MTSDPLGRVLGFWRPLFDPAELQGLARYVEPEAPLSPGINVWRSNAQPRAYRLLDGGSQLSLFAAVHPIDDPPASAEVVTDIVDRSGVHHSYVLWYPHERAMVVPFDPEAAVDAFRHETYVPAANRTALPRPLLSLYYSALKPLLPGGLRDRMRRVVAHRAFAADRFLEWPSDESHDLLQRFLMRLVLVASGRREVPFAWFWPDGHRWAAVLTHDVETADGLANVRHVAGMERERGVRSSYNLVPFDYTIPGSLLRELREDGFEIGVHGYTHDGLLFSRWPTFLERVVAINECGRRWDASGFRSPATYRDQEWFHLLGFDYDSSMSDVAPFEPQPGGCASLFPFPVDGLIELPITMPQDHTVFGLLGDAHAGHWFTKLQRIRDAHGMLCLLTHPDPAKGYIGRPENEAHYRELLDAVAESDAWVPLPRELATWWRSRVESTADTLAALPGITFGTAALDPSGHLEITPPCECDKSRSTRRPIGTGGTRRGRSISVWIDMANSPHVQFFGPLIRELEERGHDVLITARDYAQTTGLLDQAGLSYTAIGHHGGKSTAGKALAIRERARALARFAREGGADVAVHHNSYAQSLAAWSIGLPSVTLMDYEYQPANHVSFRLSSIVLVPDSIPTDALAPYGAGWRLLRYPGLKEDFYVASMLAEAEGEPGIEGLEGDRPVLVLRPPPDLAAYHRFENLLWAPLLQYLAQQTEADVLVLPRTPGQASRLASQAYGSVSIAERAIAPAVLLSKADGVITAGGTMAREAAALGIPAYTVFAGRRGGVDARLIDEGRLIELTTPEDFALIALERCRRRNRGDIAREKARVSWLADLIVRAAC